MSTMKFVEYRKTVTNYVQAKPGSWQRPEHTIIIIIIIAMTMFMVLSS